MITIGFTTNGLWKSWHWIVVEGDSEQDSPAVTACNRQVSAHDVKVGQPTELTCRRCVASYYESTGG